MTHPALSIRPAQEGDAPAVSSSAAAMTAFTRSPSVVGSSIVWTSIVRSRKTAIASTGAIDFTDLIPRDWTSRRLNSA